MVLSHYLDKSHTPPVPLQNGIQVMHLSLISDGLDKERKKKNTQEGNVNQSQKYSITGAKLPEENHTFLEFR